MEWNQPSIEPNLARDHLLGELTPGPNPSHSQRGQLQTQGSTASATFHAFAQQRANGIKGHAAC
eukprot:4607725-Amphidinium_carterae.1